MDGLRFNGLIKQIRPDLIEALREVQVKNGMFIDRTRPSIRLLLADYRIPKASKVRRELENIVDEFPLADFVIDTLDRELYDLDKYNKEVDIAALSTIEGYQDVEAVADRLLEKFQSLPWEYILTLKLPDALAEMAPEAEHYEITDDLWLRRGGPALEGVTPLENLAEGVSRRVRGRGIFSLMLGSGAKWEANALYLQTKLTGFIGPYGDSAPHRAAVARIKSFLGLLIATRAIQLSPRAFGSAAQQEILVHRKDGDAFVADNRLQMDEAASSLMLRMKPFDNDGKMKDGATIKLWLAGDLKKISNVFCNSDACESILLAGQWVFDSRTDPDALVTYIRSMIVLEILLGSQKDASELSIGDIIANRCAYLIGADFRQRTQIMKDFKKIYGVRSQIVHRGKSQLTLEERTLLRTLQWLGKRVIQEEIKRIPEKKT